MDETITRIKEEIDKKEEKTPIKEDIAKIKDWIKQQEEGKKNVSHKKFKFPFGKKTSNNQKTKGYCTFLIINNGGYYFKKYKIEDQTILHDSVPRLASAGYVMNSVKGEPLIILPDWSVEHF